MRVSRFTATYPASASAALAWLESLGYVVKHGPDIAPGELYAEWQDYGEVVLRQRLRDALARRNPDLPPGGPLAAHTVLRLDITHCVE